MGNYVTNRVFRVLTAGNVTPAATGISSLAVGELIVIKRDGTKALASDLTSFELNNDELQIVIGNGGFSPQKSDFFKPSDISKYTLQAYSAEVQKVITIDYSAEVAPTNNYEYVLVVNEVSDKEILQQRQARKQYTYVATAADTVITIVNVLATMVNADPYSAVIATVGGTLLTLTAKDTSTQAQRYVTGEFRNQINFEINSKVVQSGINNSGFNNYYTKFGVVSSPVLGVYTPPAYGEGTFRQLYKLERTSQGYKGVTNWMKFPIDLGEYYIQQGSTYDVRILEFEKMHDTGLATLPRVKSPQTYILAFAQVTPGTSGVQVGAFDTLFNSAAGITSVFNSSVDNL